MLTPVGSSREASAGGRTSGPGHPLQGLRLNAAPSFTITSQSTSCLGFLEEIFIPSRCSVGSTLHCPLPKTSCCAGETTGGQQPPVQDMGTASLSLNSFSLLSTLFLPNICFQTSMLLCHQRLFFASFLAALHWCFQQWSSTWQHIKSLFPKPSGSTVIFYMYLPNRATLLPKPKQPFFPLTHAFWREPFPCPDGYLQNLLGFCHHLSLGKGVGFLEVILSRKEKVETPLC